MNKVSLFLGFSLLALLGTSAETSSEVLKGISCASANCDIVAEGNCPIQFGSGALLCTLPTVSRVNELISPLNTKIDETDQRLIAAQTKSITDLKAELTLKIDQVAAESIKTVLDSSSVELTNSIKDTLVSALQAELTKNLNDRISSLEEGLSQDLEEKLKKYIDEKMPTTP